MCPTALCEPQVKVSLEVSQQARCHQVPDPVSIAVPIAVSIAVSIAGTQVGRPPSCGAQMPDCHAAPPPPSHTHPFIVCLCARIRHTVTFLWSLGGLVNPESQAHNGPPEPRPAPFEINGQPSYITLHERVGWANREGARA